jgi:hypothetical protein
MTRYSIFLSALHIRIHVTVPYPWRAEETASSYRSLNLQSTIVEFAAALAVAFFYYLFRYRYYAVAIPSLA